MTMAVIWLVLFVLSVVSFFVGAIYLARRKKREFSKLTERQKMTHAGEFFLKDLPPNWYISLQFCVGFAVVGIVAVILYRSIVQN